MIKINLLSPDDKNSIKWEKINSFVKINFFFIIFVQIVTVLFFLVVIWSVDSENINMDIQLENTRTKSEIKELELIKGEIKVYDKQSKAILSIQENQIYWSKFFAHLSQNTPSDVKINIIIIRPAKIEDDIVARENIEDYFIVQINGTSKEISSSKLFEERLKKSDILFGFEAKPENYTSENFKHLLSVERKSLVEN